MFGDFVSSVFKIATIPVDVVSSAVDMATGGDGSKESREDVPLTGDLERLRDNIADTLEDI